MAMVMLVAYILIFVVQIILLVKVIKKKTKKLWTGLFVAELIPMLLAGILTAYYENLPGYGFMPGLSYLGEVLFSFFAAVLYGVNFLISLCICIVQAKKRN